MEDFLNSYAFEQMAKEYNQKYGLNSVAVLSKKEDERFLLKVENAFDKVFHLFYLFKVGFGGQERFNNFFMEIEKLNNEMNLFFKKAFNKEYINKNNLYIYNKYINHKVCELEILGVFDRFLSLLQISKSDKEMAINGLFEGFWAQMIGFYKKIINLLKDFYVLI